MTCGCLQNQIRQTLGTTWAPRREYACILRVNRQKISTPCTPSFSACVYCTTPFVWHIYAAQSSGRLLCEWRFASAQVKADIAAVLLSVIR